MNVYAYCRVSTQDQTTANQRHAIERAGYKATHVYEEYISGSTAALERPVFLSMLGQMNEGDTLVVLKLDRLGRDNMDVQLTMKELVKRGVKVVSLDLPTSNLASAEGRLILQMFAVFAEFERNRIGERTKEGLARAKDSGKVLGRPKADSTTERVKECRERGMTQQAAREELGLGIATVKRHWNR